MLGNLRVLFWIVRIFDEDQALLEDSKVLLAQAIDDRCKDRLDVRVGKAVADEDDRMLDKDGEKFGRQIGIPTFEVLIVTGVDDNAFRLCAATMNLVDFANALGSAEKQLFLADKGFVALEDFFREQIVIGSDDTGDAPFRDVGEAGKLVEQMGGVRRFLGSFEKCSELQFEWGSTCFHSILMGFPLCGIIRGRQPDLIEFRLDQR